MPVSHRRMHRKDTALTHRRDVVCTRFLGHPPAEPLFQERERQQGGMAFVHVVRREIAVAEGAEHRNAANAQQRLLAKAIPRVASVEPSGKRAVERIILREVGIEQIDGDRPPGCTHDCETPWSDLYLTALNRDGCSH